MKNPLLLLAIAGCLAMTQSSVHAVNHAAVNDPSAASLARYHWQLHDAVDARNLRIEALFGIPDKPLQLDFAKGRITVSQACNRIGGAYHVVEGHLDTGPLMQTMMACGEDTLMKRESTIKSMLQSRPMLIFSSVAGAPLLALVADSGQTLTFAGVATAQTRYGGTGETIFLEVAAQTTPCSHPLIPDRTCLFVRQLHYDANGVRTGQPGPWQALPQDIEGYVHQSGVRDVLRVHRYALKQSAADAPATAYVLDTVVESETVKPSPPADSVILPH